MLTLNTLFFMCMLFSYFTQKRKAILDKEIAVFILYNFACIRENCSSFCSFPLSASCLDAVPNSYLSYAAH